MRIIPARGTLNIKKNKGTFYETREDVKSLHDRSTQGQVYIKINDEGITTVYFGELKKEHFHYYVIGLSGRPKDEVMKEIKRRYEL